MGLFAASGLVVASGTVPNEIGLSIKSVPAILSTGITRGGSLGLFLNVVVVNIPQLTISFMNMLYNSLFSCIILNKEWKIFASQQKPLRVTVPAGEQKCKYYLTIPYRFAIPVLALTGIFHWLISESLFLVRITAYGRNQTPVDTDFVSSIGYSGLAILLAAVACLLLLCLINVNPARKQDPKMPVAGSCSAVISAACHPPKEEGIYLRSLCNGVQPKVQAPVWVHGRTRIKILDIALLVVDL